MFSLDPRCHGLRGSQKYTSTPVSTLNRRCSAISFPWSQVSERRSWTGSVDDARLERFADRLGVGPLGQRDELAIAGLGECSGQREGAFIL